DGSFEFRGVPPGTFTLHANGASRAFAAKLSLTITGDTKGVRLMVDPATGGVTGRISVEAKDTPLQGTRVSFMGASRRESVDIRSDKTFDANLPAGHYDVSLSLESASSVVIKSIRSGSIDVFQEGLTVADDAKTPLEIVLAPDGGKIEGIVRDREE